MFRRDQYTEFVQKRPVDISSVGSEGTSRHKQCWFRRDPKIKVGFVQKGPVDISRVCSEGTSRHKSCLFRRDQ